MKRTLQVAGGKQPRGKHNPDVVESHFRMFDVFFVGEILEESWRTDVREFLCERLLRDQMRQNRFVVRRQRLDNCNDMLCRDILCLRQTQTLLMLLHYQIVRHGKVVFTSCSGIRGSGSSLSHLPRCEIMRTKSRLLLLTLSRGPRLRGHSLSALPESLWEKCRGKDIGNRHGTPDKVNAVGIEGT